jgi:hypothetical protein
VLPMRGAFDHRFAQHKGDAARELEVVSPLPRADRNEPVFLWGHRCGRRLHTEWKRLGDVSDMQKVKR